MDDDFYVAAKKNAHFRAAFPSSVVSTSFPLISNEGSKVVKAIKKQQPFIPVDAETGSPLKLTLARWNSIEGRVNMDRPSIVATGTGKLNVRKEKEIIISPQSAENFNGNVLAMKYISDGPINSIFHKDWDPKVSLKRPKKSLREQIPTAGSSPSPIRTSRSSSTTSSYEELPSEFSTSNDMDSNEFDASWRDESRWRAVRKKIFDDLFSIASQMETNKSLTLEKKARGGIAEVKSNCKLLASMKVKYMKDLTQAIDDEFAKEMKRSVLENETALTQPQKLKQLKKTHERERQVGKEYIEAIQYDSEVIFIRKLSELGYLW